MIAKISSGKDTAGLIRYLYGPGRANEHTDPHLVASFDGFTPDPGRTDGPAVTRKLLVADLDLRVKQAKRLDRAPKQHVWHCSIRASPGDRHLTDDEWADIARRVVEATGIAPEGDPDGCRWVAVRHADDHIHIAATKVRGDLRPARHWNDYLTADRELVAVEKEHGLHRVVRGDRTVAQRPTRAETEKARRTSQPATARERLRSTVRTAVAASTSPEEFLGLLGDVAGVLVQTQYFPSGDIRGYKIALGGDTNAAGQPIWFSGSKLASDLSFPKIQQRLTGTGQQPTTQEQQQSGPNAWHRATAAAECIPDHLDRADDEAAQAHLAAFGEALDALPLQAPEALRPGLRQAAATFERATRSRIQAEHQHAHQLRTAIRSVLREPAPKDGAALAMFLDAALLVATAAARWHKLHQHDQQVVAAQQTLIHLQAAYDEAAVTPLAALGRHRPPRQAVDRYAGHIRQAVPGHAHQVLADPAVDALTATLAQADAAGHDAERVLQQAVGQRPLDDARHPAQVLTWRIQRLLNGPASRPRARAAQARSSVTSKPSTRTITQRSSQATAVPATSHKAATPDGRRR